MIEILEKLTVLEYFSLVSQVYDQGLAYELPLKHQRRIDEQLAGSFTLSFVIYGISSIM